jgi:outer membrane protein assembly factor BamD (BamD/ComL family)
MLARQFFAICAALWVICVAPQVWAAQDEIVLKTATKEEVIRGEIRDESIEKIKMVESGGQPMPDFTGSQVMAIRWGIEDFDYMSAMGEYEKNHFAVAANSFKACVDNPNMRKATSAYLAFICGDSYRRANKTAEAEAVLEKLIEQHPKSWYMPDAIDALVDVSIVSGNFKKIPPLLEKLRQLGGKYVAKAVMYEGQMLLQTKKYDDAQKKFAEAASGTNDVETQGQAQMLVAQCQVLKKEFGPAKQTAEKVLATNAPGSVMAAAHLVVGNALYAQAMEAKGDDAKELYLDAVLEYLRVWTLYPGSESQEGEALYKAGESFKFLSRLPGRRNDRRRAVEMFAQVGTKYPGSYWAKQAEKAMAEVK